MRKQPAPVGCGGILCCGATEMGYATKGLAQIIQLAKILGYKKLFVTTDDKNIASQNLIKKLGFKICPKNSKQQIVTKKVYEGMSQYYLNLK